jgi:predicted Rossmann-fold nucleotide-binding protein
MTRSNRMPIVAVFGGSVSDTLAPAEFLGAEIAVRRWILLTGGTGAAKEAVSERAIVGTKAARADADWIGVARSSDARPAERSTHWIRLWPGYTHKRNYVEASLCDAAIALPGGDGTASEVAFCLSLRRPVAFVGSDPLAGYRGGGPERVGTVDRLVAATHRRMRTQEVKPSPLDQLIAAAIRKLDNDFPETVYLPTPEGEDDSTVVEAVSGMIVRSGLRGEFPALPGYDAMAADYRQWLGDERRRPVDPVTGAT